MLRRIVAATMIGALALTSGCAFHNPFAKKAEPVTYEAVVQSELSPEEKVDKLVANMSDADKVGQLLMIGIHGTTLNDDAKFMLNEYRVGGIIPVSYTHLDVYKRQIICCSESYWIFACRSSS